MAVKVGFVSLGCPKNLINTEVMLAKLAAEGFEIVAEDVDADVIVINTCAFIESAKQEAIDNILDVASLKENHTLRGIVVTGCLPNATASSFWRRCPRWTPSCSRPRASPPKAARMSGRRPVVRGGCGFPSPGDVEMLSIASCWRFRINAGIDDDHVRVDVLGDDLEALCG